MNVDVRLSDLLTLVGRDLSEEELEESLFLLKCEIDSISNGIVTIEVNPDRVDLLSVEGIARALRGFLEIETGAPNYSIRKSDWQAIVDPSVKEVRPFLACGIVKGLQLDDDLIAEFMQLQERLTGTFGRNRKRTSIGLYVLDLITPPVHYRTESPDDIKFVPLEYYTPLTARQILSQHPKGQEFGKIIKDFPKYPILVDAENKVLSLPPVINSNDLGRLVEDTKDVFVEVTGTHKLTTLQTLNIMITALAERGGIIEDVEVVYTKGSERLPDLTFQQRDVSLNYINKIVGYDFDDSAVMKALGRMRMDSSVRGDTVQVKIPAYRMDILHDVDIVEDVAIGYGYDRFESTTPQLMTLGRELPLTTLLRTIRDLMVGLAYQEIHNYVLTNTRVLFEKMNRPMKEVVEIANPKSMEYHLARNALLPGLLAFLGDNTAQELPHNIFEVGDVVTLDANAETCTRSTPHLAAASVNSRVDITVLKAKLMTLLGNLGLSATVRKTSNVSFIKGRVANLFIEGTHVGIMGEIHPAVLKNYGIEAPCVAFELEILADWIIQ
ncbi:MAG: phenylalanine--tRNA ligase subunit beta [Candidatus Hermodarchaeota archaeon]|nr:phenylalanine--tRNA ligase subunit beta [Candidatus Hermodarchaeota archaeon]